jgi:leader peptidase (prepilin peptidase)/N-methyltransferase
MLFVLFLVLLFLCWGSFLNVVAYRMTYDKPFFTKRSYCPSCEKIISWYDNIPVISWIFLRGKCRNCKSSITILYPFTEILSAVIFTFLFFKTYPFKGLFFVYFIFFSALIAATRTDFEEMVIPQALSLWLIPVGILSAILGYSFVPVLGSVAGAIIGYGSLWLVGKIFYYFTKREGIGVGDMELLGMIGAFLGPLGVWFSVFIGSLTACLIGGTYILITRKGRYAKIPFGPFLALGATFYFFFSWILLWLVV